MTWVPQVWPQLVPFSFWAVSRADRDDKLQWLTRTLRLDDVDWQYIIDLLTVQADPPNNNMQAAEILDRLDVGESVTNPTDWQAMTRCMFADAGYSAMAFPDGTMAWVIRVGSFRIQIADATGGLGVNPWDQYFVSVCAYNSTVQLVSVEADDINQALALGNEAQADPQAFINKYTVPAAPAAVAA